MVGFAPYLLVSGKSQALHRDAWKKVEGKTAEAAKAEYVELLRTVRCIPLGNTELYRTDTPPIF